MDSNENYAQQAPQIGAMRVGAGTLIYPYGVLITGQARARGLTLVTRGMGGFSWVANLCAGS